MELKFAMNFVTNANKLNHLNLLSFPVVKYTNFRSINFTLIIIKELSVNKPIFKLFKKLCKLYAA
jgi:hypothetical protein